MVRILILLLLLGSVQAQTIYCGQDTDLSAKQTLSNMLTYSEDFTNAAWANTGTTDAADSVIAPDGALTADILIASAGSSVHRVKQNTAGTLASGTSARISVYYKAGTHAYAWVMNEYLDTLRINLSTGATALGCTTAACFSGYSVTSVGNGWYRVVATYVKTDTSVTQYYLGLASSSMVTTAGPETWAAAGTETIYAWGASVQATTSPSDYLVAVAAATTLVGVCPSGTTQSPLDPTKCINMSDRGNERRTQEQIAAGVQ